MAATIDSYTAAARLLGIAVAELIPLPMISRSVSPVSLETSAQVRRETTADLILVRSPSWYCGNSRYSASQMIRSSTASPRNSIRSLLSSRLSAIDACVSDSLSRSGFLNL